MTYRKRNKKASIRRQDSSPPVSGGLIYRNETLQQTSRPLLSKLSERRQIKVFDPHFEEVRGGVEHWLMARWKDHVDFLLTVIELLYGRPM